MKGCAACGSHTAKVYDWHHPGEKNFQMRNASHYSDANVHAELLLCEPMCHGCHTSLHMQGNQYGFTKGKAPWNKGRKLTPAHKAALSKAHKGKGNQYTGYLG